MLRACDSYSITIIPETKQNKTKRSKKKKKRADERRQNISCCNLGLFLGRLCWYVFLFLKFKKGFRFQPVAIIILFLFFSSLSGVSPA